MNRTRAIRRGLVLPISSVTTPSCRKRRREAKSKELLDDQLDVGLEGSFPGSDPVAVTQPPHSPYDRRKP